MKPPYTCLYREVWDDQKFYSLSEVGKLVYFYVLSTPLGNGLGCFKAGKAAMIEESRMLPERFEEGFTEGLQQQLFAYDGGARVLLIPKYFERNAPANPNGIKALAKEFVRIPCCELKRQCYHIVCDWVSRQKESFAEPFAELFQEPLAEPSAEPGPNDSANNQVRITPSPSPSPSYTETQSVLRARDRSEWFSMMSGNALTAAREIAERWPDADEAQIVDVVSSAVNYLALVDIRGVLQLASEEWTSQQPVSAHSNRSAFHKYLIRWFRNAADRANEQPEEPYYEVLNPEVDEPGTQ